MKKLFFATLLQSLILVGCAGSSNYMQNVPEARSNYAPQPGQALMVFMRPSGLGYAIQSSVFDISSGEPVLVGIVSAKTKLAYDVAPGNLRFMVIGESADFMDADIAAGKTYYAIVAPRMGMWKARFSLRPVHKDKLGSTDLSKWLDATRWVENTPDSARWAKNNGNSIRSKQGKYLPKWLDKDNKPILVRADGQ